MCTVHTGTSIFFGIKAFSCKRKGAMFALREDQTKRIQRKQNLSTICVQLLYVHEVLTHFI